MILCDFKIQQAIAKGDLVVTPKPTPSQFDSTSLNLRVGDDFTSWNPVLSTTGFDGKVNVDTISLSDLLPLTVAVPTDSDGMVSIPPGGFVLVRTLEHVIFPLKSKLAARVEGRSTLARLGLTVHQTAPTIHAGFDGKITLEMINRGPFTVRLTPNVSEVCQLIIERVTAVPRRAVSTAFLKQPTPLGTPKGSRPPKR